MRNASSQASCLILEDCRPDEIAGDAPDRWADRADRETRRPRGRDVEGRLQLHTAVLLDRTLRAQERAALRRGLKIAQASSSVSGIGYTNATRVLFVFAVIAILIGAIVGISFAIMGKLALLIACAGLLFVGFGLLGIAARKGASEVRA